MLLNQEQIFDSSSFESSWERCHSCPYRSYFLYSQPHSSTWFCFLPLLKLFYDIIKDILNSVLEKPRFLNQNFENFLRIIEVTDI